VLMGMGEPLANYRNVMAALRRINTELGIGARKITVSTVGVVPSILKLIDDPLPIRLAVSLHCADTESRSALMPANTRYGGLDTLMTTIHQYITTTGRRVTFEWALIDGVNDSPEVARNIGRLIERFGIRKDMVHVNLIPLNPTGGFSGNKPSGRGRMAEFVRVLEKEFKIGATPRVRRGIDIEAGCGQLKSVVKKREEREEEKRLMEMQEEDNGGGVAMAAVVVDHENHNDAAVQPTASQTLSSSDTQNVNKQQQQQQQPHRQPLPTTTPPSTTTTTTTKRTIVTNAFSIADNAVDLDEFFDDDDEEEEDEEMIGQGEIERLLGLVADTTISLSSSSGGTAMPVQTQVQTDQLLQPQESVPSSSSSTSSASSTSPPSSSTILVGPTTKITDEESIQKSKKQRKKLLKNLRAIEKLQNKEKVTGKALNEEQRIKVEKEAVWRSELESIEHNLQ